MDLLKADIRPMYLKYLSAAFGSAMITSVYSIVDMAMVGQYQGPDGTAALAVVAPIWNVVYSLGLLMGIGGSVLFSISRGASTGDGKAENELFTAAVIGSTVLAVLSWAALVLFEEPILVFFGADEGLLALAKRYLVPVLFVVPLFLFNQMLAAFLRNDGDPALATAAVLGGGVFNMFGDYFFVFTLDMGIFGAGLATAVGSCITFVMLLMHFVRPQNTLRIVRPHKLFEKLVRISVTGFSSFFVDAAMGILTVLFNRQIMAYLGTNALSVYGIIINISTFVQCCAYSVGQAAQPIVSTNYGAGFGKRIKQALKCALWTAAAFGIFWTALSLAVPNAYIRIFMTPTAEILSIAPGIIRSYSLSFLLLPLNIFSTYYFQAILKPREAFVVSVGRGCVISGVLIIVLPLAAGADALWFAMPITELITACYVVLQMRSCTAKLPDRQQ